MNKFFSSFSLIAVLLFSISEAFTGQATKVSTIKKELLDLSQAVNKGADETPEQRVQIRSLFEKLEKLNPVKKSLSSELVNGIIDFCAIVFNFKYIVIIY